MAAIRAIGFDYLGVVARLPAGDFFDEVAELAQAPRSKVKATYGHHSRAFQTNQMDMATLWRHVAADLGIADRFEALWRAANQRVPIIDLDALKLVEQLRQAQYRVGLLSNLAAGTPWAEHFYGQHVDRHFDAVGLSGEIGFAKPDIAAFEWLASSLGVRCDEMIFIDDRLESMAGVEAMGIRPILYHNLEQLKNDLLDLNVELD